MLPLLTRRRLLYHLFHFEKEPKIWLYVVNDVYPSSQATAPRLSLNILHLQWQYIQAEVHRRPAYQPFWQCRRLPKNIAAHYRLAVFWLFAALSVYLWHSLLHVPSHHHLPRKMNYNNHNPVCSGIQPNSQRIEFIFQITSLLAA